MAPDSKTGNNNADTKAADTKAAGTKTADIKAADTKTADTRAADTRAAETEAEMGHSSIDVDLLEIGAWAKEYESQRSTPTEGGAGGAKGGVKRVLEEEDLRDDEEPASRRVR
ncbi:hypothetical protein EKO27_g11580 [Xylaria grammica]|uniref:Uncharacterized protein n=1 Tax=Xylaria grammica TaxID=363999 RepID=A0A439CMY7_9PEZI|nr:hypothetical protein EKO27_g11580 [Xylaria grammica]